MILKVVGDMVPKLCLEHQWVLCISHTRKDGNAEVARHLAMMNKDRKQDSVIFVGAEDHGGLLKVRPFTRSSVYCFHMLSNLVSIFIT